MKNYVGELSWVLVFTVYGIMLASEKKISCGKRERRNSQREINIRLPGIPEDSEMGSIFKLNEVWRFRETEEIYPPA